MAAEGSYNPATKILTITGDGMPTPVSYGTFPNVSNPYTPAVNLVFALDEALKMMREEGLENIFKRHNKHKLAMSNAIKTLNLKICMKQ